MPTSPRAQRTDFSLDIAGRYTCNGLDEALASVGPGARPFDLIVVGGGSFGAALAQQLFANDQAQVHRILVLEGGPLALPEHVQNMPLQGLGVPPATSIAQLRSLGQDGQPRAEVWGLAWHSSTPFPGLAYCLAGRSLYFGGWSPQLLNDEMPTAANAPSPWPQAVVNDLNNRYFAESAAQIGTEETNDFIFGPLQNALRQALYDGINNGVITEAIPLGNLPDHPVLLGNPGANAARLRELLGNPPGAGGLSVQELRNLLKLEAPLAVQGQTLPGFFPFNKFSSMPLLMKAARSAQAEANNNDARKRLMVVPNCHANRLQVQGGRVVAVDTNQGVVSVPANGKVVVALGTIESARLALNSFAGLPSAQRMGRNLMAHLRSNLTIRIPRGALAGLAGAPPALQAAALFCKCRHQVNGNDFGYFHMQITAAGLGALGTDSEAELFKLIPDIDTLHRFTSASDTHVVITIRSIGEMQPQNANSFVRLDPEPDEFGAQRAFVQLQPTARDNQLWQAMDTAADQTALVFAAGGAYEVQTPAGFVAVAAGQPPSTVGGVQRRDGLGTTHHEAGTLWMGDNPAASVTDRNARFHDVTNAHALGPALQPTVGSPNPMLTSIALGRRLADHLVPVAPLPAEGPRSLFNGQNLEGWEIAGQGSFVVANGVLQAGPGGDLGLLWCTTPTPRDFILRCEWRPAQADDNSGVFVCFPNPNSKGYNNTAYVAVHFGFEVQIDEAGAPDGADQHRTGAIYAEPNQAFNLQPALPVGQWNAYEIRVDGPQSQTYTVLLNGAQVTQFNNPHAGRGLPSRPDAPSFIGLQAHTGNVAFRNIELQAL
jgi:choline dehydrogenase-like flavoprotein